MSNTARTATTSADTSGMFRVATYFTDSTGKIISNVAGENHVDKYFRVTPTPESTYKIIETKELIFKNWSDKAIYTSADGLAFSAQTPVTCAGSSWDEHAITFNGGYYQMLTYDGIYRSTNLKLWSRKYTTGYYSYFYPIVSLGNVLVTAESDGTHIIYSTDGGSTWTVHSETISTIKGICIYNGVLVVSTYLAELDMYTYITTYTTKLIYYSLSNISANSYASYLGSNVSNPYEYGGAAPLYISKMYVVGTKMYYVAVKENMYMQGTEYLSYMTSLPAAAGWSFGTNLYQDYYGIGGFVANSVGHIVGINSADEIFSPTALPNLGGDPNKTLINMYKDLDDRIVIVGHTYDEPTSSMYSLVFKANDISGSGWTEIPTGSYTYPQAKFNITSLGSRLK